MLIITDPRHTLIATANRGIMALSAKMKRTGLFIVRACAPKSRIAGVKPVFILADAQALAVRDFVFMSTSKLQRYVSDLLSTHFGGYTIRENLRPEWLMTANGNRLELDFYIEELRAAIEVQGEQHFIFVPHFHGSYRRFQLQQTFDRVKREMCEMLGVKLIEVLDTQQALDAIDVLKKRVGKPTTSDRVKVILEKTQEIRRLVENRAPPQDSRFLIKKGITDLQARCIMLRDRLIANPEVLQQIHPKRLATVFKVMRRADLLIKARKQHLKETAPLQKKKQKQKKVIFRPDLAPNGFTVPPPISHEDRRIRKKAKRRNQRARKLQILALSNTTFIVWGGNDTHTVTVTDERITCDCQGFWRGQTKLCSHIAKYQISIAGRGGILTYYTLPDVISSPGSQQ